MISKTCQRHTHTTDVTVILFCDADCCWRRLPYLSISPRHKAKKDLAGLTAHVARRLGCNAVHDLQSMACACSSIDPSRQSRCILVTMVCMIEAIGCGDVESRWLVIATSHGPRRVCVLKNLWHEPRVSHSLSLLGYMLHEGCRTITFSRDRCVVSLSVQGLTWTITKRVG